MPTLEEVKLYLRIDSDDEDSLDDEKLNALQSIKITDTNITNDVFDTNKEKIILPNKKG